MIGIVITYSRILYRSIGSYLLTFLLGKIIVSFFIFIGCIFSFAFSLSLSINFLLWSRSTRILGWSILWFWSIFLRLRGIIFRFFLLGTYFFCFRCSLWSSHLWSRNFLFFIIFWSFCFFLFFLRQGFFGWGNQRRVFCLEIYNTIDKLFFFKGFCFFHP